MRSLSIRKLDGVTYGKLQKLAIQHEVSMEEKARQILQKGVAASSISIADMFRQFFGKANGVNLGRVLNARRREKQRRVDFS